MKYKMGTDQRWSIEYNWLHLNSAGELERKDPYHGDFFSSLDQSRILLLQIGEVKNAAAAAGYLSTSR